MSLTVLYVEDETELLTIFDLMFGDEYDIRITDNPLDALRMLLEHPADIIISDQSMPQMNGTEFLREAAKLCPDSFRIMITGYDTVGGVFEEIANGIIHVFIPKPWTKPQMQGFLQLARNTLSRRDGAKGERYSFGI